MLDVVLDILFPFFVFLFYKFHEHMVSEMCVKVWAACFQALQHSGSILCVAFCRHSCWHDTWPPGRLLPPPAAPCFLLCPTCCLLHCTEPWQQTNNWKIFTLIENISSPIEDNAFEEEFSLLHHNDKAGVRCWPETTTSSVDVILCHGLSRPRWGPPLLHCKWR